jgi:RHS repeat-associated protein
MGEFSSSDSWNRSELWTGARHLTTGDGGYTYFYFQDIVGTNLVKGTDDFQREQSCDTLPFGENYACWGNANGTTGPYLFTDKPHDSEDNLDHFWFRAYSSTQGRWMVPDPAGLGAANYTNPQTWNRYAYVNNNPVNTIDPLGLMGPWGDCVGCNPWMHSPGDKGGGPYGAAYFSPDYAILSLDPEIPFSDDSMLYVFGTWVQQGWSSVSSPAANNGRMPNSITCSTVLPNGRTVGSYVQAVSNQINGSTSTTPTPYGPVAQYNGGPSPLSVPSFVYSSINFKIMFQGQGNAAFLGDAGNFAYGAISANVGVPLWATEAVAGGYALWAGHQDTNGPFWMDASATQQVPAGYSAQCK